MSSKTNKVNTELTYPQLHDIPQISISEAKTQLELTIKSNQSRGCLTFVGEAGVGKTQIVYQTAAQTGYKVVPIRTAQWGPLGCGVPSRIEASNFFKLIVPDIFPKEGEKSILLFDEINRGQAHAIAMFFNLLEDREMFDYKLPEECIVVATMNPATANYKVTSIENEAAIRRRLKFMYVNTSFTDFIKHANTPAFHQFSATTSAKDKSCHHQVLDFFRAEPDNIYDRKAQQQNKQFTCPATIETISEDAYLLEEQEFLLDSTTALIRYAGSIGENMAHQLLAYITDNSTTISAADVLSRYKKVHEKVVNLVKNEKHENLTDLSKNVLSLLFAETPDVTSVANNLLPFWQDLPKEIITSTLSQMKTAASSAGQLEYLKTLMTQLGQHEQWVDLHLAIDKRYKEIDQQLKQPDDKAPKQ